MNELMELIKNAKAQSGSTDDDMTFILKNAYAIDGIDSSMNLFILSPKTLWETFSIFKEKYEAILDSFFDGKMDSYSLNQFLNSSQMGEEYFAPDFVSGSVKYDSTKEGVLYEKLTSMKAVDGASVKPSLIFNRYKGTFTFNSNDSWFNNLSIVIKSIRRSNSTRSYQELVLDGQFILQALCRFVFNHNYTFSINAIQKYDDAFVNQQSKLAQKRGETPDPEKYRTYGGFVRGIVNGVLYFGNSVTRFIPWSGKASYNFYGMNEIIEKENKINELSLKIDEIRDTPINAEIALKMIHNELGGQLFQRIDENGNPVFKLVEYSNDSNVYERRKAAHAALTQMITKLKACLEEIGVSYYDIKMILGNFIDMKDTWAQENVSDFEFYARGAGGSSREVAMRYLAELEKNNNVNLLPSKPYLLSNYVGNPVLLKNDMMDWALELKSYKENLSIDVDKILEDARLRELESQSQDQTQATETGNGLTDIEKQALLDQEEKKKSNKLAIAAGLAAAMAIIASAG